MKDYDVCTNCDSPMREYYQKAADHPGTRQKATRAECYRCYVGSAKEQSVQLTPADLEDQRHILLSDAEMAHIYEVDSFMYDWHLRRRYKLKIGEAA